jgi:predicted MFS family arabinose efflux permease
VLLFTPLLASVVLDSFHFRALLWLLVAFTAVGFLLILAFVPETPRHARSAGFDWIGAVLLGGSAAVLAYALGEGIGWGWSSQKFLGMIILGAVLAVAFVLVERASANPLIDVRVLARREVSTVLGSTSLAIGASFAMTGFVAILLAFYPHIPHLSDGLGWSATHYALIALPGGVLMLISGFSTAALIRRTHPKLVWWTGAVFLLIGMIWTAYNHHDASDIIISWLFVGIGSGFSLGVSPVLVLTSVTKKEQGQIGGMQSMLINLANALGIEVATIMLNRHAHLFHGTAFYVDPGFRGAYLLLAAMVVLGLLVTLAMPKSRRPGAADESQV